MTTEERLKELILSRYPTMKDFSFACGVKYTTLLGLFTRGLNNANISNVIAVCKALNIDTDALSRGEIVFVRPEDKSLNITEISALIRVKSFEHALLLDDIPLTESEAEFFNDLLTVGIEMLRKKR